MRSTKTFAIFLIIFVDFEKRNFVSIRDLTAVDKIRHEAVDKIRHEAVDKIRHDSFLKSKILS